HVAVHGPERALGAHDAATNREQDAHETLPAVTEGRPPAEPPRVPSRDARLVQGRKVADASAESLRDAQRILLDVALVVGVQERILDPIGDAVMNQVQDRLNPE